jgi:hypothetical protein
MKDVSAPKLDKKYAAIMRTGHDGKERDSKQGDKTSAKRHTHTAGTSWDRVRDASSQNDATTTPRRHSRTRTSDSHSTNNTKRNGSDEARAKPKQYRRVADLQRAANDRKLDSNRRIQQVIQATTTINVNKASSTDDAAIEHPETSMNDGANVVHESSKPSLNSPAIHHRNEFGDEFVEDSNVRSS